jgi:ketosteroid isomerase-like protein
MANGVWRAFPRLSSLPWWAFSFCGVGGAWAVRHQAARAVHPPGIPDVHYGDDEHWVSGNHGVSRWTLRGTRRDGKKINVRGCDLLEFRDGKMVRKDSYWKIVEPRS